MTTIVFERAIGDPSLAEDFDPLQDILHFDRVSAEQVTMIRGVGWVSFATSLGTVTLDVKYSLLSAGYNVVFRDGSSLDGYLVSAMGSTGSDLIQGNWDDNALAAMGGWDTVFGGGGNDRIAGQDGNDLLSGDGGHDLIYGNQGADVLGGGSGRDSLYGGQDTDGVNGGLDDDLIYGNQGADELDGGSGTDRLYGGQGEDLMRGGAGDDLLSGNRGNDTATGGDGDDVLLGGLGSDILIGGDGSDLFVLEGGYGFDLDIIADFTPDDRLVLRSPHLSVKALEQLDNGVMIRLSSGNAVFVQGAVQTDVEAALAVDSRFTSLMPSEITIVPNNSEFAAATSAVLGGDGFVVTWLALGADGANDLMGRVHDAAGNPLGDPFQINQSVLESAQYGSVHALAGGGFVAVWGTVANADGSPMPNYGSLNTWGGSGDFLFTVMGRMYDDLGRPLDDAFLISGPGDGQIPQVTALADGGFAAAWTSCDDARAPDDTFHVQVTAFNRHGHQTGEIVDLGATGALGGDSLIIEGLADGNFLVNWTTQIASDGSQTYSDLETLAQIFDPGGNALGAPVKTYDFPDDPQMLTFGLASLADGRFVFVHAERINQKDQPVWAQFHNADGTADGAPVLLHNFIAQWNPVNGSRQYFIEDVIGLEDGSFVLSWATGVGFEGTMAQRFDAQGNAMGDFIRLGDAESWGVESDLDLLGNGNVLATWSGYDPYGNQGNIYLQEIQPIGQGLETDLW